MKIREISYLQTSQHGLAVKFRTYHQTDWASIPDLPLSDVDVTNDLLIQRYLFRAVLSKWPPGYAQRSVTLTWGIVVAV